MQHRNTSTKHTIFREEKVTRSSKSKKQNAELGSAKEACCRGCGTRIRMDGPLTVTVCKRVLDIALSPEKSAQHNREILYEFVECSLPDNSSLIDSARRGFDAKHHGRFDKRTLVINFQN